jgi:hypothetical protein
VPRGRNDHVFGQRFALGPGSGARGDVAEVVELAVDQRREHRQAVVLLRPQRPGEQRGQDADGLPVRAVGVGVGVGVQRVPLNKRVQAMSCAACQAKRSPGSIACEFNTATVNAVASGCRAPVLQVASATTSLAVGAGAPDVRCTPVRWSSRRLAGHA